MYRALTGAKTLRKFSPTVAPFNTGIHWPTCFTCTSNLRIRSISSLITTQLNVFSSPRSTSSHASLVSEVGGPARIGIVVHSVLWGEPRTVAEDV